MKWMTAGRELLDLEWISGGLVISDLSSCDRERMGRAFQAAMDWKWKRLEIEERAIVEFLRAPGIAVYSRNVRIQMRIQGSRLREEPLRE